MKTFDVWFEIFGKKMKTTVSALNKDRVKIVLSERIIIHKVEEQKNTNDLLDDMPDVFKDIFGGFK